MLNEHYNSVCGNSSSLTPLSLLTKLGDVFLTRDHYALCLCILDTQYMTQVKASGHFPTGPSLETDSPRDVCGTDRWCSGWDASAPWLISKCSVSSWSPDASDSLSDIVHIFAIVKTRTIVKANSVWIPTLVTDGQISVFIVWHSGLRMYRSLIKDT